MATNTSYSDNYDASLEDSFRQSLAVAMAETAKEVQLEDPSGLTAPVGYNKGLYGVQKKKNLHEERVKMAHEVLGNPLGYASSYSASAAENMDVYGVTGVIYMAEDDELAQNSDYSKTTNALWTSWAIQQKENIDLPGWNYVDIKQAQYYRPKDLLIYYGYPNSFNSGNNSWDNEKVSQDMSKYGLIVLGDGVGDTGHADYSNTSTIVPRIKELNKDTKIFGYVTVNQGYTGFKGEVDGWDYLGVHGVFMDEAGYDFGSTGTNSREAFNEKIDYIHSQSNSNICFANAWNTDHILGTANDVSYPNTIYNPDLVESQLTNTDWILLESFPINTTSYTASTPDGYESKADWLARGDKAVALREEYGVNFAGVGIINNDNGSGSDLFDFGFVSSLMYALDGFGTSDTSYAASSAAVTFWTRPDSTKLGILYQIEPNIEEDGNDSDVYWRYAQYGSLKLDFSSSAQASSITKW